MAGFREDSHFFGAGEGEHLIYGCTYLPDAGKKTGIVLVSPVGRQRLRCYHESANMARALAGQGFPVVRFDYRGEGESSGVFSEATLSTRLEDIASMVEELRRQASVQQICLVGFRLGGLLAVLAARDLGIQQMILCDPVCTPRKFSRGMLRSNILLQSQYFGEVFSDEKALRKKLAEGRTVSVYGFHMGLPLLEELEQTDPEQHLSEFRGEAAIIYLSARTSPPRKPVARWCEIMSQNGRCETICVPMAFSWASRKMWMPELQPLNQAVIRWLEENV